ncbi:MAG: hypothetical protein RIQ38_658 [Pseudomonadota bacterium]
MTASQALPHAAAPAPTALVLMGGGARAAWQAGVLHALGECLQAQGQQAFPFPVLVGTSAGALNSAFLASHASRGIAALGTLAPFWQGIRTEMVCRVPSGPLARLGRWAAALGWWQSARAQSALLDGLPLAASLHQAIDLPAIDRALSQGVLTALAVTASSYTSGTHWTFCQTADRQAPLWDQPGQRAAQQPITIEHLMASSAIPFIFPPTPLWVDERVEFFGDGSMRQLSPLSPAGHLGARRVLALGVGQPQRAGLGAASATAAQRPGLGQIAGHAMASVFHDTLLADVARHHRTAQALAAMPPEARAQWPLPALEVLALQPSVSLDALAQAHVAQMPPQLRQALGTLGALRESGAALASYLLFEPGFIGALLAQGAQDLRARQAEVLAFLAGHDTAAMP